MNFIDNLITNNFQNTSDKDLKILKNKLNIEIIKTDKLEKSVNENYKSNFDIFITLKKDAIKESSNKRFRCKIINYFKKVIEILNDDLKNIMSTIFDYNNNFYSINILKLMLEICYSKYKNFDSILERENPSLLNLIYYYFGNSYYLNIFREKFFEKFNR